MKFNYTLTLNIILFCIFKFFIVIDLCLNNASYHFLYMLRFTKKHKEKYLSRIAEFHRFNIIKMNDKKGVNICYANTFFGASYCGYAFIFIGSIFGTLVRFFGEFHGIVVYLIPIIPIAIWWYPAQRAVFYKDRYLKYFKQFEKKEKHWLRKWMLLTLAFFLGSILSGVLGMYLFFAIAIGRFDLWNLMH